MSEHHASIHWHRSSASFGYPDYNRAHSWSFPGGVEVPASAATQFLGDVDRVDPEEAFVAAIAACHMLTFLAICARKRITVNRYSDEAVGYMELNDRGRLAVSRVRLNPEIDWQGDPPTADRIRQIHHQSHKECFIANSVLTEIEVAGYGSSS